MELTGLRVRGRIAALAYAGVVRWRPLADRNKQGRPSKLRASRRYRLLRVDLLAGRNLRLPRCGGFLFTFRTDYFPLSCA